MEYYNNDTLIIATTTVNATTTNNVNMKEKTKNNGNILPVPSSLMKYDSVYRQGLDITTIAVAAKRSSSSSSSSGR